MLFRSIFVVCFVHSDCSVVHSDGLVVAIRHVPTADIAETEQLHICYPLHDGFVDASLCGGCGSVIIQRGR